MKLDPKLLKKVVHSTLIQAANLMGIKNPDGVSKENLIPAFLKAVEAIPEDVASKPSEAGGLDDRVIEVYNHIVQVFGLDKEPAETETQESKPDLIAPEESEKIPIEKGVEKVIKPITETKVKKVKEVKEEKEPAYSRFDAIADTFKEMRKTGGKFSDFVAKAFKRYSETGGGGSLARMQFFAKGVAKTLQALGIAEVTKDGFKIIAKQ